MAIRRMASINTNDEDRVSAKDSALIEECVTLVANKILENPEMNAPNFMMCVTLSLLTTLAINEGMDEHDIKKLMKLVKKELIKSAKQFYDGDVKDLGVMETPQ